MYTTWGYYGKRNGRGEPMGELLSKAEQEEKLKSILFAKAQKRKLLGLPSKTELELKQHELDTCKGVCPICHMQRAINGSCNC